jgi:hypothetical protein
MPTDSNRIESIIRHDNETGIVEHHVIRFLPNETTKGLARIQCLPSFLLSILGLFPAVF